MEEDIIIRHTNVTQLFRKQFSALKGLALIKIPPENALDIVIESLKTLYAYEYGGIYVALLKTYAEFSAIFNDHGINQTNLFFIDCISRLYAAPCPSNKNVEYIQDIFSMEKIYETLEKTAQGIKNKNQFVLCDAITTLMLYNSIGATIAFVSRAAKFLKTKNIKMICIAFSGGITNESLSKELAKMSNERIDLSFDSQL